MDGRFVEGRFVEGRFVVAPVKMVILLIIFLKGHDCRFFGLTIFLIIFLTVHIFKCSLLTVHCKTHFRSVTISRLPYMVLELQALFLSV